MPSPEGWAAKFNLVLQSSTRQLSLRPWNTPAYKRDKPSKIINPVPEKNSTLDSGVAEQPRDRTLRTPVQAGAQRTEH